MIQAFYVYINLEKKFQIFVLQKSDFFQFAWIARLRKKVTYYTITF